MADRVGQTGLFGIIAQRQQVDRQRRCVAGLPGWPILTACNQVPRIWTAHRIITLPRFDALILL
jgi:hypothetical protein